MAELNCTIYCEHKVAHKHRLLKQLIAAEGIGREERLRIVEDLNPDKGRDLFEQFEAALGSDYHEELFVEEAEEIDGYWCISLMLGGQGDYVTGRLIKFLGDLSADVSAQAWGCGDDDPWEFWFKYENGRVIRCDHEPYDDDEADEQAYNTVYRWWHEGLPGGIREGFLNEEDDDDPTFQVTWSDERFGAWLDRLRGQSRQVDTDDLVGQGMESPVSGKDVKELMSAMGDIFSMFTGAARLSGNHQENAFDATEVTEVNVRAAYDDLKACEADLDPAGVLKHISKNVTGEVHTLVDNFPVTMPMRYSLYKMGLAMLLKTGVKYTSSSNVESIESSDVNTATMKLTSVTEYVDPETKKLTRVHSQESNTWGIEQGKLLITAMNTRETSRESLE